VALSSLTTAEIEALRFFLGYGNISIGGYPYTPDGFFELFNSVVAPNLTSGEETTATTAIVAGSTTTVTPVSMTSIVVGSKLVVDVGAAAEVVSVKSVTGSTFSASFVSAHPASGYPVALFSGVARCRMLLDRADRAWTAMQDVGDIASTAGLKKVDEIEWYGSGTGGNQVLSGREQLYNAIVANLSSLVRVERVGVDIRNTTLEPY
jgi:hypothetical protein